jgi:hypothetical protein
MTGPLYGYGVIGITGAYVVALIIGIFFGFVLERAGFGDARNLVNIFYFRDMRVLRVMFTAIITALAGLVILSLVGLFDYSMLTKYYLLNTYLWPQLLGGIIFGLGFVIGGYCPGTSVVGIASGKYDALVFFIGLALGIFVFAAGWPIWGWFYKSSDLGKLTLWQLLGISKALMAALIVGMALIAFYLARLGEKWAPYGKWGA